MPRAAPLPSAAPSTDAPPQSEEHWSEGLEADDAWVAKVAEGDYNNEFGVPLTAAEAAELERRADIAQATGKLADLQTRSWFAGLWIDQNARERL